MLAVSHRYRRGLAAGALAAGLLATSAPGTAGAATPPVTAPFPAAAPAITSLGTTVPTIGDLNPYGVAVVPASVGRLHRGDVLVSNFNNSANQQGTGTTIVEVPPHGQGVTTTHAKVFATVSIPPGMSCPGGVGLTTALAVFRSGFVVVGSLPTTDGTAATAQRGCLIVLNADGQVVRTIAGGLINGPWDLAATQIGDDGVLFVSNVLNGITPADNAANAEVDHGTVVRVVIDLTRPVPRLDSETVIAAGFGERTDPAALVIGPTGAALSPDGRVLYVADTLGNRIMAVPDPLTTDRPRFGTGHTVSQGGALDGPLGVTTTANGDILTVNSNDGHGVAITPSGGQVAVVPLDTTPASPHPGAGTLFGLALTPGGRALYFVDDGSNTLNRLG